MTLSHDPLWPRAGGWPGAGDIDGALDAAILGIPTHRTSLSPTRAGKTPAAIREAVRRYSPVFVSDGRARDLSTLKVADGGDVAEPDGAGEQQAEQSVAALSARTGLVVALGGDNAATVSAARGVDATGLITLDAHHDLRDGVSNGSPVRRLLEAGLDGSRVVQIGIADFANSASYLQRALDHGITVITRDDVQRRGVHDVMAEAVEIAGAGDARVHLDVDVDVCDRSVAPACPASVPGGLQAWELRALVRLAAADPRVVGADIVEVDAAADTPDGRTVRLAALCLLELLAGRAGTV